MGRITLFIFCLTTVGIFLLSGCSSVQKKSHKQPASEERKVQQVMISTGIRHMPQSCKPADTITVKIDVIPANQISGVIVTEKIPEGWKIVKSEPQFSRIEPGNVYKWLQWGQQVAPFTITYQVKAPEKEKGKYTFEGNITTFREGDIPISGNTEILVK